MVVAIEAMFRMSLLINDAPIAKLRGIEKHIVVEGIINTILSGVMAVTGLILPSSWIWLAFHAPHPIRCLIINSQCYNWE